MVWSWALGRLAGIQVRVHATFLLLVGWIFFTHVMRGQGAVAAAGALVFLAALFGSVLLHELGHALTARRFGIGTRDITLLPIGGVARLDRMPENPRQELWVALAGPAVNFAIAGLLYVWLAATGTWAPLASLGIATGSLAERLLVANVSIGVFNLIPAFPMDGGRVLRALLALRIDRPRATVIAATIGRGLALVLGVAGLFSSPMLVFIAIFVWMAAGSESAAVQAESALAGMPLRQAMVTRFATLAPTDTLGRAADALLVDSQQDFPVVEGGVVTGLLTREDLTRGLAEHGRGGIVRDASRRALPLIPASATLESAWSVLQSTGHAVGVADGGRIVGLVTMDSLEKAVMIRSALVARERTIDARLRTV